MEAFIQWAVRAKPVLLEMLQTHEVLVFHPALSDVVPLRSKAEVDQPDVQSHQEGVAPSNTVEGTHRFKADEVIIKVLEAVLVIVDRVVLSHLDGVAA